MSPRQLLDQAIGDARARGSVREVEHDIGSDGVRSVTNDVGEHAGTQKILLSNGNVARVLVDGETAYIRGNAATLSSFFGIPSPVAKQVGHRWISVPSTNRDFGSIAYDVTLATVLKDFAVNGHLVEVAPTTINGQPVIGILGAVSVPGFGGRAVLATVYFSNTRKPLPVKASYQAADGSSWTTLSHWGEKLSIAGPRSVVSSSALGRTPRARTGAAASS